MASASFIAELVKIMLMVCMISDSKAWTPKFTLKLDAEGCHDLLK
jgi:hypothetical protein